jgi:hypothetical protein
MWPSLHRRSFDASMKVLAMPNRPRVKPARANRVIITCCAVAVSGGFLVPAALGTSREQVGDGQVGRHGHGHDRLHSWYETLRQPGTGYPCCNNQDCRPTTARMRGRSVEVLVDGEWTKVPRNTIVDTQSPDLNTHVCAPKGPWSPKPIFCVVLGLGV